MAFTTQQTAAGILTTISRGDWSLAVSRLKQAPAKMQSAAARIVEQALSADELAIWWRYWK